MSDRIFLPAAAALAILLIALSLVWPQGYGRRSPAPFGSAVVVSPAGRQDQDRAQKVRAAKASAPAPAPAPTSAPVLPTARP